MKSGLLLLLLVTLGGAGYLALQGREEPDWWGRTPLDVAPVTHPLYAELCGECHFAYQPGLLPQASWERVMSGLEDHFGEYATLEQDQQQEIISYLREQAAEHSHYKRSRKIASSQPPDEPVLRITETHYYRHKHEELGEQQVAENPEVGSFSNCDACHPGAADGVFDEHAVLIPGYGGWSD